jgi:exonuclease SbcC
MESFMPLSTDAIGLPSGLTEALGALLPTAQLEQVKLREDLAPVIIMLRGHAVDAFAVGGMDDYEALYAGFKNHYRSKGSEWVSKEISFVLCIPPDQDADQRFCSRVEVDVYFCRKYVLRLTSDVRGSLSRLPFIPLEQIAGASIRPPSAKTLLRNRSLKPELANALVDPGTGAATILDNSLAGRYGQPVLASDSAGSSAEVRELERPHQATLKSISIENFRAYRALKTFELGSKLTVLYGPNGFGKTSFFDALDFAVTGAVGRLANAKGGLAKAAKHLDSAGEPTSVTVKFEQGGQERVLVRTLSAPTEATLDGEVTSRKSVLAALTGGMPSADRVENLVSLFRATHLFSQDNQELTREFSESSTLPGALVSRMLAFDDYVNGVKKSAEVCRLAKQRLEEANAQMKRASEERDADETELQRLKGIVSGNGAGEGAHARVATLAQSARKLGVQINAANGSPSVRLVRAALEARLVSLRERKVSLEACRSSLAILTTRRSELEGFRKALVDSESTLKEASAIAKSKAELQAAAESALSTLTREQKAVQNTRDWLAWSVSVAPTYSSLKEQVAQMGRRHAAISANVAEARAKSETVAAARGQAAAALEQAQRLHGLASLGRATLEALRPMLEACTQIQDQVAAASIDESACTQALENQRAAASQVSNAVQVQSQVTASLEQQLNSARADADQVDALVAALRSHTSDGTCLLCGHDHGSHDALLAAIDSRARASTALEKLSDALAEARTRHHELQLQAADAQAALQLAQEKLRSARAVLQQRQQRLAELKEAVSAVGLTLDGTLLAEYARKASQATSEEARYLQALVAAQEALATAEKNLVRVQEVQGSLESELAAVAEARAGASRQLAELTSEAARGLQNLDAGVPALQEGLMAEGQRLAAYASQLTAAAQVLERSRAEANEANSQVSPARRAYTAAQEAVRACETDIARHIAVLTTAGVTADATHQDLLNLTKEVEENASAAAELHAQATQLEVQIDAQATSAAFESIRARLETNARSLSEAKARAEAVKPWMTFFEAVSKLLSDQQAQATRHFTTEYGPRTAVIQRRLRPVYGFDDISVNSKEGTIEVHVKRGEERLRPPDYFSQSQVQTLVLGLFLTACSSQTWSGFSSVMMDDPVTHFDDLNTYALLDLIAGLQTSPEGARQFVIATCDEKLLQLARQKFRHLGDETKFYRFQAIGSDGPMVSELPN